VDAAGKNTSAPLVVASPSQITFQVPATAAAGTAKVTVTSTGSTQTAGNVVIAPISPALFTANGNALLLGWAVRVSSTGTQTTEPVLTPAAPEEPTATPISMGAATDKVFLCFYATGVSAAGLANVSVTVDGVNAPVTFVGNGGYPGIDQVKRDAPRVAGWYGNNDPATHGLGYRLQRRADRDPVAHLGAVGQPAPLRRVK
jgi:uncharacterized protein (TIGR03437 family)